MISTLSDMRTECEDRGFDFVSPTRIDNLINFYYHDLCRRHPWPFLETTTSGTAPVTIANLGHVLSVVDTTNDSVLRWEDRRSIRERDPGMDKTGHPEVWYQDAANNQLEVYPVNTTNTIAVDYTKVPTTLCSDSDEPVAPQRYRYVIVEGAVSSDL